eukprot:s217_g6.t1
MSQNGQHPKGSVGRLLAAARAKDKAKTEVPQPPKQPRGSVGKLLRKESKESKESEENQANERNDWNDWNEEPKELEPEEPEAEEPEAAPEPPPPPKTPKGSVGKLLAAGKSSKAKEEARAGKSPHLPRGSVGRLISGLGRLPRVGHMMRRRAQQRPLRPRSPTKPPRVDRDTRPASPKRIASHDGWEKLAQRRGSGSGEKGDTKGGHFYGNGKGKEGKGQGKEGGKGRDAWPLPAHLPHPPHPPHPPDPPHPQRIPPKARPALPGSGKGRPVPTSSVDETSKRKMSFKDVAAREVKKRRTTVKMVHWSQSCQIRSGIAMQIKMSDQGLSDQDLYNWVQWMASQLPTRPGKSIALLDLSNNSVTSVGVNFVCNFLQDFNIRCDHWDLSGNPITDEGLLRIARHVTAETGPALRIEFNGTQVTVFGFQWLLTILSLHPLYPVERVTAQGQVEFQPLWVGLRDTSINTKEVEDFFLGGRFESLCCSVCLEPCHEDRDGRDGRDGRAVPMRCRAATGRKSNVVMHLAMELPKSCREMAESMLGICSKGIMQLPRPRTWRNMWLQGEDWQRHKWQREEPQFLYEDSDFMVLMKPATWHCSSQDQGRNLLKRCQQMSSNDRKMVLQKQLMQQDTPALHDYLILRFGADPMFREVMREDMLYGMVHRLDVGTTGSLLLGKTLESFRWAKEQIIRQALVRDYIALVHGTFAKNAKNYKPRGLIMAPIDKTHYNVTRRCEVKPQGQHAATHYECLAEFKSKDGSQYSLLHCRLLTGRTHQIRVHCEHIGLPLVGDKQYYRKRAKHDPTLVCNRPFLHKVRFVFSQRSEEPDLVAVLKQLKISDWRAIRAEDLGRLGTIENPKQAKQTAELGCC